MVPGRPPPPKKGRDSQLPTGLEHCQTPLVLAELYDAAAGNCWDCSTPISNGFCAKAERNGASPSSRSNPTMNRIRPRCGCVFGRDSAAAWRMGRIAASAAGSGEVPSSQNARSDESRLFPLVDCISIPPWKARSSPSPSTLPQVLSQLWHALQATRNHPAQRRATSDQTSERLTCW